MLASVANQSSPRRIGKRFCFRLKWSRKKSCQEYTPAPKNVKRLIFVAYYNKERSEDVDEPIRSNVSLVWPLPPLGLRPVLVEHWTRVYPLPGAPWPSSPSTPLPPLCSSHWGGRSSEFSPTTSTLWFVSLINIIVPIVNVPFQAFSWRPTRQKKSWGRPSLLFCLKVLAALLLLVSSRCLKDQWSSRQGDWCCPVGSWPWPFAWNTSARAHYRYSDQNLTCSVWPLHTMAN